MSDDEDGVGGRPGSTVDAGDDGGSTGFGDGTGTEGTGTGETGTDEADTDEADTDETDTDETDTNGTDTGGTIRDGAVDEVTADATNDVATADARSDDDAPTAHTTERRSLSPGVQLIWGLGMLVPVVVLTLVASYVAVTVDAVPSWAGAAVGLVLLVVGVAWVHARYRVWVYEVREDSLYLERGVLTHVRTIAPYVRIQHVDTQRGPLERWLGLSTLVVYTAGTRGADVSIPGLTRAEARDLQERVKELAIRAEGGDAV